MALKLTPSLVPDPAVPDAKDASTDGTLTIGDARDALRAVCDRTDAQLGDVAGRGPDAEPAHLVVPKVALLVAVATHLNLGRISYRRSTGGCAGLLLLGDFTSFADAE